MKTWIKNTLIFTAGIAVGVGATYFYLDKKISAYFEERAENPTEVDEDSDFDEYDDDDIAPIDPEKEAEYLEQHERECEEEELEQEAMMSAAELEYAARDAYWDEMVKDSTNSWKENDTLIRIITVQEFEEECDHHDKVNLVFYAEDQYTTELDDEIFENEVRNLGKTVVELFELQDEMARYGGEGDPDTIYIRNNRLAIDYEIQRMHNSYREYVLGEVDE